MWTELVKALGKKVLQAVETKAATKIVGDETSNSNTGNSGAQKDISKLKFFQDMLGSKDAEAATTDQSQNTTDPNMGKTVDSQGGTAESYGMAPVTPVASGGNSATTSALQKAGNAGLSLIEGAIKAKNPIISNAFEAYQKRADRQAAEGMIIKGAELASQNGMSNEGVQFMMSAKPKTSAEAAAGLKSMADFIKENTTRGRDQAIQEAAQKQKATSIASELAKFDPSVIKAKLEEKKAEKGQSSENNSTGTYRFLQQFQRSYDELKKFDPEVDKQGIGGYASRFGAKIAEHLDELPETSALKIQVLPMANGMAREIEGGRVTDNDRKIYADSFANALNHPIKSNIRLMSQALIGLIDKGGDENGSISKQLKKLSGTNSDIFNSVVSQIITEFPEMAKKIYGEDFEVVE